MGFTLPSSVIPLHNKLSILHNILDSSYRTAVDNAVLKLAESGKLVEIKNRWWKVPKESACVVSRDIVAVTHFL